jgi:hypothetical protein
VDAQSWLQQKVPICGRHLTIDLNIMRCTEMPGLGSFAAKAVITDVEQKVNIYHTIKAQKLDAQQIQRKYKVCSTTAYHWKKLTLEAKDETGFVKKRGRPPILSDRIVLDAKAKVDEMTRSSQPLNTGFYTENVKNAKDLLSELIEKENASKFINKQVAITPKLIYKQMVKRLKLKQMTAKTKTNPRLEAINDPRNAIAFLVAAMVVSKLVKHIGLFFNGDATGFEHKTIQRTNATTKIWADHEVVLEMKKQGHPVASGQPLSSSTGVFIKSHNNVSATGDSAPFVISVADKSMTNGESDIIPIERLGMNNDVTGYIAFHKSRNGTDSFYKWMYETVVIPFICKTRRSITGNDTDWCVYWIDGEDIAMSPILEDATRTMFLRHNIIVFKGPASTTEITQLLDASMVFKDGHSIGKSRDAVLFAQYNNTLRQDLLAAMLKQVAARPNSYLNDTERNKKFLQCILTSVYGMRKAITPSNVMAGLHRTGMSSLDGVFSPKQILSVFGVQANSIEIATLLEECIPLVKEFRRRGFVLDSMIEKTSIMQRLFFLGKDSPTSSPRDIRAYSQQRCNILTLKNLPEEIANNKIQFKATKSARANAKKAAGKAVKPVTVGAKLARKPTKNAKSRQKQVKQHHVLVADGPIDRAQLLRAAGLSTNAGRVRGTRT